MNKHVIIEIFSERWWYASFLSIVLIAMLIYLAKFLSAEQKMSFQKAIGFLLLLNVVFIHPYLFHINKWNLQSSLPLHLCGITSILAAIVLLFPSQWLFEVVLYFGISGGFHSLLTPELTEGDTGFLMPQYFIAHGGMIFAAVYLSVVQGYKPSAKSWWQILIVANVLAVIVGIINYFSNANYMYLCQPPTANNPLVIGKWPWYIAIFEVAGLAHFIFIYLIFKQKKSKSLMQ